MLNAEFVYSAQTVNGVMLPATNFMPVLASALPTVRGHPSTLPQAMRCEPLAHKWDVRDHQPSRILVRCFHCHGLVGRAANEYSSSHRTARERA